MTKRKPPRGTVERIAMCKRHRPTPGIDLRTGEPNGRIGCWFCGADLTEAADEDVMMRPGVE